MATIAIYARKSVYREDSLSIESQIEMCTYEARGEDFTVYQDNGFSGKDTDRPDFQRMLTDIQRGEIRKVIVYKLDRISRSVLDFSEMMQMFQRYHVDFVSATEHFDTGSPMGRAMLNICIVFAQLERETIQQRVIDAYAARSKRGLYMGGVIPYGYRKIPAVIDGVHSSMYEPEPEEAEDIRLIFQLYSRPSATLGDVLRELVARGMTPNRRGKHWNTARLSELMRNPSYTTNDPALYDFFTAQKSNIVNPVEQYDGQSSLYLFTGGNTNRKTWDLSDQNVVIAPHTGIIEPSLWLTCRKKLLSNHQVRDCKAKNSFLAGKVKCGYCGYALVVRYRWDNKSIRYLIDTGREMHACLQRLPTIHVEDFEDMILERIKEKLAQLHIRAKANDVDETSREITRLQGQICETERRIDQLVECVASEEYDAASKKYFTKKIQTLDAEKHECLAAIDALQRGRGEERKADVKELTDAMCHWDELTFDDKRDVIALLIHKITVTRDKVEIHWNV